MDKALTQAYNNLQLKDFKTTSEEEQFQKIVDYLDHLVTYDFNKLLSILYRVDVSEDKAKMALANKKHSQTNGYILAKLLIEREAEKIKWRAHYRKK